MDLASPLHSLIPALSAATLEVLSGTESALGTTQIARLAGRGSAAGHQKSLDRLVEHGLVIAEPVNRGFIYRLNRDHVLIPALLAALEARDVTLRRLTAGVENLAPAVAHASVFGSFARQAGTEDSDIDLLLVVEDEETRHDPGWVAQLRALENSVRSWTGNRLEPLVFSYETLTAAVREQEPVVDSVVRQHTLLAGASLVPLLNSLTADDRPARSR